MSQNCLRRFIEYCGQILYPGSFFPLFLSQNCQRRFIEYCGQMLYTGSFFHFFCHKIVKERFIEYCGQILYTGSFFHFFSHKNVKLESLGLQSTVVRYCTYTGSYFHFLCHKKFIEGSQSTVDRYCILGVEWQVSRNFAKCKRQFCETYFAKVGCEKRRKWSRLILTHFGPKLVLNEGYS